MAMATDVEKLFPGHFEVQWSETLHMLDLSANQIDLTVLEGDESIELLMNSFSSLTDNLEKLETMLPKAEHAGTTHTDDDIGHCCAKTKDQIHQCVIGLQFYDRLTQRLHNVRESLVVLAALIDDPKRQNIPEEWVALRRKIKSKYSAEQQKTIFHALMQGADIDEVFELFDND